MIENIEKNYNNEEKVFDGFILDGQLSKESHSTIYGIQGSGSVKSIQLLNPGEDSPEGIEKFINWAEKEGLEVKQGTDGYTYTKHEMGFNEKGEPEAPVYKPGDENID